MPFVPIAVIILCSISAAASVGTLIVAKIGVDRLNTELNFARSELHKVQTQAEKTKAAIINSL